MNDACIKRKGQYKGGFSCEIFLWDASSTDHLFDVSYLSRMTFNRSLYRHCLQHLSFLLPTQQLLDVTHGQSLTLTCTSNG